MNRRYYSKRHFDRLSNGPKDTEDSIRQRLAMNKASKQALKDREKKYPILTPENAREAIQYQENRIQELYKKFLEKSI